MNRPFIDGNKRSMAFSFVWFLSNYDILNIKNLTTTALTSLIILIAESNSNDKHKMIGLVLLLIT